jgi:hypothetical protein
MILVINFLNDRRNYKVIDYKTILKIINLLKKYNISVFLDDFIEKI